MSRAPGLPGVHFTLDRSGFFWSIRQPAVVHDRQFAVYLAPVPDRHRPLFGGLESREVERLEQRGIAWTYAARLFSRRQVEFRLSMALVVLMAEERDRHG